MAKELNVKFKNGSTVYSDKEQIKQIEEYAQFLKETDLYTVIEGHTSSLANAKFNYELSSNRAIKVRAKLIDLGVDSSKVKAMGFGESLPLYDNNTEDGASNNRRVVGEIFNSKLELENYSYAQKNKISATKYKEQ
jgi:outer membrane protein OmpA-like peptidoglycan-associated protein